MLRALIVLCGVALLPAMATAQPVGPRQPNGYSFGSSQQGSFQVRSPTPRASSGAMRGAAGGRARR